MNGGNGTKRRKGFRQVQIVLNNNAQVLVGANAKRCGLLLNCTAVATTCRYTLDGSDPSGTLGIALTSGSTPFYLPEEAVADIITDVIKVHGTLGQTVTCIEWYYLD